MFTTVIPQPKFVTFINELAQRRFDISNPQAVWIKMNVGYKRVIRVDGKYRCSIYRHGVLEREYIMD